MTERDNPPEFKPGSVTWWGLRKWRYFFEMFFSIANPDGFNFFLTPYQYQWHQSENPRLMAILLEIQKQVRAAMPKPSKIKKPRTGMIKKRKRR